MAEHNDIDQVSGTSTTGHQWDGIKELNTPLPRWWVITFYITIIWSIGYWIVYPAWPLLASHTTGVFGYSSRADVAVELANLEKIRGDKMVKLGAASLAEIEKDPALLALARARGKTVFGDNCAPCHGSGGAGAKGYPNLNDDEWIWGGSLDKIMETIQDINRKGVTVFLSEQNARMALEISSRGYVLENGHIVLEGTAEELAGNEEVKKAYIGA